MSISSGDAVTKQAFTEVRMVARNLQRTRHKDSVSSLRLWGLKVLTFRRGGQGAQGPWQSGCRIWSGAQGATETNVPSSLYPLTSGAVVGGLQVVSSHILLLLFSEITTARFILATTG